MSMTPGERGGRLPQQMLVEVDWPSHGLADPAGEVRARLTARLGGDGEAWRGRRVAVAVGSRGIDQIVSVVRTVVEALTAAGASPFVIPAMGSHGGATGPGQAEMLAALGVIEASVGASVVSSLDTIEIAKAPLGFRVFASRDALEADAVVLINRVKPHTDFASTTMGSGLLKMCAIGIGKADGAFECHQAATRHGHEAVLREASRLILGRLPVVLGVALVEDAHHRLSQVEVLEGREFETREPELLRTARDWMPSLPFSEIDVLIVDEMGKNISGAGMDTNIVGRGVDGRPRDDRRSTVRCLYVRGLTAESHGNAVGVGMADVVSSRLVNDMDERSTYMNVLSALTPAMARMPMHFANDVECLEAAIRLAGAPVDTTRVVRVRNTLALDRLVVSPSLLSAMEGRKELHVAGPARPWAFTPAGDLDPAQDLLRP